VTGKITPTPQIVVLVHDIFVFDDSYVLMKLQDHRCTAESQGRDRLEVLYLQLAVMCSSCTCYIFPSSKLITFVLILVSGEHDVH
jgi:hypothetical protein